MNVFTRQMFACMPPQNPIFSRSAYGSVTDKLRKNPLIRSIFICLFYFKKPWRYQVEIYTQVCNLLKP